MGLICYKLKNIGISNLNKFLSLKGGGSMVGILRNIKKEANIAKKVYNFKYEYAYRCIAHDRRSLV